MTTLARIQNLTIAVDGSDGPRDLLRGIDVSVDEGETVGLVGESGSGKSLTARTLIGFTPDGAHVGGEVTFRGESVLDMRPRRLRVHRSQDVAMIFQDPRAHINPLRSVGDFLTEVLIAQRRVGRSEAMTRASRLLGEVGVTDPERRLRQRPYELSGGLLQRVMIASVLAVEPRLVLADEPTTALDVTTQEEVMAILGEAIAQRGMSLLFITHDLDLAAAMCDTLVVMRDGSVVERLRGQDLHEGATADYTRELLAARVGLEMLAGRRGEDPRER